MDPTHDAKTVPAWQAFVGHLVLGLCVTARLFGPHLSGAIFVDYHPLRASIWLFMLFWLLCFPFLFLLWVSLEVMWEFARENVADY